MFAWDSINWLFFGSESWVGPLSAHANLKACFQRILYIEKNSSHLTIKLFSKEYWYIEDTSWIDRVGPLRYKGSKHSHTLFHCSIKGYLQRIL